MPPSTWLNNTQTGAGINNGPQQHEIYENNKQPGAGSTPLPGISGAHTTKRKYQKVNDHWKNQRKRTGTSLVTGEVTGYLKTRRWNLAKILHRTVWVNSRNGFDRRLGTASTGYYWYDYLENGSSL